MKLITLLLGLGILASPLTAEPQDFKLDGVPFHPNVEVTWAAKDSWPASVSLLRVAPESFSPAVVSNAMAIGSFKPLNRVKTKDSSVLRYQDHHDKFAVTRYLEICPSHGWMSYYDANASGVQTSIHDVPDIKEAVALAIELLHRLGGNTNEVAPRRGPPGESTMTSFDRKTGEQIGKAVYMRSVTVNRQIEGIQLLGNSLAVDYSNDGKPSMFKITWQTLRPERRCNVMSRAEVLKNINAGKAVIPDPGITTPQPPPVNAKSLAITETRLFYKTVADANKTDRFYPFAQFIVTADAGSAHASTFLLECLIAADE